MENKRANEIRDWQMETHLHLAHMLGMFRVEDVQNAYIEGRLSTEEALALIEVLVLATMKES